jgi:hypothetical protein
MRNHRFIPYAVLMGGLCWALNPALGYANLLYAVSLDTSPLIGHPAAPFYLEFQLNDGSGTGDGNNTVTLSDFNFGLGGSAVGSPVTNGSASGNLTSGVTITDSDFFNEFYQELTPGDLLTFNLAITTNVELPTPDQFSFAIFDSSLSELPTQSTFGAFVEINLDSPTPVVQTYYSLSYGIEAPTVKLQSVPAPATLALLGIGFAGLGFNWRRKP